jgi:hypothetical protein
MAEKKSKLVYQTNDLDLYTRYRIVLVGSDKYYLEEQNGRDAMGVPRWKPVTDLLWWPDDAKEDSDILVPRSVFRDLVKISEKIMDAETSKAGRRDTWDAETSKAGRCDT